MLFSCEVETIKNSRNKNKNATTTKISSNSNSNHNSKSKKATITKPATATTTQPPPPKLTLWVFVLLLTVLALSEVDLEELSEGPVVLHQLCVAAHLRDLAVTQHHDLVHQGEPVNSVRHQHACLTSQWDGERWMVGVSSAEYMQYGKIL